MKNATSNIISIEQPGQRRLAKAREVAAYLGVSVSHVIANAERIPGYLNAAFGERRTHRWDMRKVELWQEQQEQQRHQAS